MKAGLRPRRRAVAILAGGCALAACGYRLVDPAVGGGRTLAVPTPRNDTRWRGVEAEFCSDLRADLQRLLDVRLSDAGAELRLDTEIREIARGAPVREQGGGAALGTTALEIAWSLRRRSGELLRSGQVRRATEFLPGEREDAYIAIREILDSLAELVVVEIGASLSQEGESS